MEDRRDGRKEEDGDIRGRMGGRKDKRGRRI
jgi:hypothetical protein